MAILGISARAFLALSLALVAEGTHDKGSCAGQTDRLCEGKPVPYGDEARTHSEAPDRTTEVSYMQLKAILSSGSVQLFDVRNPDEFQAGQIPGSTNIPLGELQEVLQMSPSRFQRRFGVSVPLQGDTNIVLYCQRGRRSAVALGIMKALGFNRARHYAGGYSTWAHNEEQRGSA